MQRILITGGLGYLGGRIASHLRSRMPDADILLATRSPDGPLPSWSRDFQVMGMDLLDAASLDRAARGMDVIIHLAAMDEQACDEDPAKAMDVNIAGTYRLLAQAVKHSVSRIVYFSTIHVYGRIDAGEIRESRPAQPVHPYAYTHRAAEDVVRSFGSRYGLKTLIFRLSNAYGCPMDARMNRWNLIFNDCARQLVTTGRIQLASRGTQHRDFVSLGDVARAVGHFLAAIPEDWQDGLFHLGGDTSMSVLDAAEKVADVFRGMTGKRGVVVWPGKGGPAGASPVQYSIRKLLHTGFRLQGDMDEEVRQTLLLAQKFFRPSAADCRPIREG